MTDLKLKILEKTREDLMRVESALEANLGAHLDLVRKIAGHILFSGGKRLRPLLMILSARLCGYPGENVHDFSTIFEYLHAATLIHDDLVDEGAMRRGKPSAHTVFGPAEAVLTGDFLLARSLSIAADTGKPEVIRIIAGITEAMSQGEIQQLNNKGRLDLTEVEYDEIIRRKTAVLIEGACRVGAMISDAPSENVEALGEFGYHIGMAFQMADDLLDYTADTSVLGKAVGADLREGKLTLPVISTLQAASPEDRERMEKIIRAGGFSILEFNQLVDFLNIYGGIDYTRHRAESHLEAAKEKLSAFESFPEQAVLIDIADYVLSRKQ